LERRANLGFKKANQKDTLRENAFSLRRKRENQKRTKEQATENEIEVETESDIISQIKEPNL
jgi:hypothetical protein